MCRGILGCFGVFLLASAGCSSGPAGTPSSAVNPVAAEQENGLSTPTVGDELVDQRVEASCGQCQFGMPGEGCDLAIRWQDQVYWVDGSGLDDHGDAHAEDGLCNRVREAVVSGILKETRFTATNLELLDEKKAAEEKDGQGE